MDFSNGRALFDFYIMLKNIFIEQMQLLITMLPVFL